MATATMNPVNLQSRAAPAESHLHTHPFTCNACQMAFRTSEKQKDHMHTDWHRYNLKRRIADLPPISSAVFAEKVLQSQQDQKSATDRARFEQHCKPCGKTYYSSNSYDNHIGSLKHKEKVKTWEEELAKKTAKDEYEESLADSTFSLGEPTETASKEAAEEFSAMTKVFRATNISDKADVGNDSSTSGATSTARLPITACLYCTNISKDFDENVKHMEHSHSLFIPEPKYLVDKEGLIEHLGEMIAIHHACITCQRAFGSIDAVRAHMRASEHFSIPYDTEEDQVMLGDYYDFRSSYPDFEDEERKGYKTENGDDANQAGWETDSDAESVSSEDLGPLHADPSPIHSVLASRRNSQLLHHHSDGWHAKTNHLHHAIIVTDNEMHMPSGRTAGHRSLNKYFRQNLHSRAVDGVTPANRPVANISFPTKDDPNYSDTDSDAEDGIPDDDADIEEVGEVAVAPPPTWVGRRARGHDLARREPESAVSRANGGTGLAGVPAATRRHVAENERRGRTREQRARGRHEWNVQKQANSQKHFRDPLLQ